jgi:hypothetical protein
MHVVIKDISQGLSLETGASYSFMVLMLPNGQLIRAEVDDEALAQVTQLFMSSGSPAAEAAAQGVRQSDVQRQPVRRVEQESEADPGEPEQLTRDFSPLTIQEEIDGEMVSTFGGNFEGTELAGVGEALQQAEAQMARAIGDTSGHSPSELRSVVDAIAKAPPVMPVPNLMKQQLQPKPKPRLTVEADAMGNPLIKGAGLVDPRAITGGNTEGEEDAGQV